MRAKALPAVASSQPEQKALLSQPGQKEADKEVVEDEQAEIKTGIMSIKEFLGQARKQNLPPKPPLSLRLKMLDMDSWPSDTTFRREDIYDDRGL